MQRSVDVNMDTKFDLSVSWSDADGDGIDVAFESGIGEWPGLEERFVQVLNGLMQATSNQSQLTQDLASNEQSVHGNIMSISSRNLSLLPHEETKVLKWGQGDIKPVRRECLHELFEKQARENPHAIALYDKQCTISMTYGELDYLSDALALKLQALGAKTNTFVGLLMSEKTFDLCVALLGILKSGAAYVPMDPVMFSLKRSRFIVNDTEMNILVTVRAHEEYARGLDGDGHLSHVVFADKEAIHAKTKEEKDRVVNYQRGLAGPEDYGYMIYTSGTTGNPKGESMALLLF